MKGSVFLHVCESPVSVYCNKSPNLSYLNNRDMQCLSNYSFVLLCFRFGSNDFETTQTRSISPLSISHNLFLHTEVTYWSVKNAADGYLNKIKTNIKIG